MASERGDCQLLAVCAVRRPWWGVEDRHPTCSHIQVCFSPTPLVSLVAIVLSLATYSLTIAKDKARALGPAIDNAVGAAALGVAA